MTSVQVTFKLVSRGQDMKKQSCGYSANISSVCRMLDKAVTDYEWHKEEIQKMEALTQDYLHSLELDGLKYKERAKIATQLSECRKKRREHKDAVMVLEPLVQYLSTEKGRQLNNLLKEVLGKTRKVEEKMQNRTYRKRVLQEQMQAPPKPQTSAGLVGK